jgi:hypothetical protein
MFLDDQLYLHVKNRDIKKAEDFNAMICELYRICETYYKSKLPELRLCHYSEITQLLDKTFRFWDMFIQKLEKENYWGIDLLKMPEVTYKNNFLSHPELKKIYELGKK